MAQVRCLSCREVGGAREVETRVTRAGISNSFLMVLCIKCTVGMTTWMRDCALGVQEGMPLVATAASTRRARAGARRSRAYGAIAAGDRPVGADLEQPRRRGL